MRIVYQSFAGRYCDSPRVLFEALARRGEHDHVWLAAPGRWFPDEVETVPYGSAESVMALEAADLLIANTHTEIEWDKRSGAIYLQTWHGTPLKRIHWDVLWAPEGRLERLSEDVSRWDVLVSPNAASTPLLRQAFRYGGRVIEAGYPRNEPLLAPDRDAARAHWRAHFDVPDGKTAVLYAPTWRDDAVFANEALSLGLDLEAFARRLGNTHKLLARLHPLVADRVQDVPGNGVRDVSDHPEIADLYLAADVLVTDYSSAMFDFAVTGRPILLHAYDRADYEHRLRGFYFDLDEIAPGPLLQTTDDVIAALRDLPNVRERYGAAYARFRDRFCHLDDGAATDRLLAALPALAT